MPKGSGVEPHRSLLGNVGRMASGDPGPVIGFSEAEGMR